MLTFPMWSHTCNESPLSCLGIPTQEHPFFHLGFKSMYRLRRFGNQHPYFQMWDPHHAVSFPRPASYT
eukprot:8658568-Prorocentrum_lima.AAC.1